MKRLLDRLPLHTLLFPLYAPVAFLAWNIEEMRVEEITRPILFSLLRGLVLFIGFLLILKNPRRAGLAATVVLLLLLSYG